MKTSPRLLRSLVFLLLLLPLLFQAVVLVTGLLAMFIAEAVGGLHGDITLEGLVFLSLTLVITGYACFRSGRALVRKGYAPVENAGTSRMEPSRNFFMRYPGVVIACGYTMLAALIAIHLSPRGVHSIFDTTSIALIVSHLPSLGMLSFVIAFGVPPPWLLLIPPFFIYLVYAIGMAREFRIMGTPRAQWHGKAIFTATLALCAMVFVWRVGVLQDSVVRLSQEVERVDDKIYTEPYVPFRNNNKLAKIPSPTLEILDNHPRLDGATALYPVYAAAAQAIYKIHTFVTPAYVQMYTAVSTTPKAYENLIEGRADIIFCAQPSPAQIAAAKAKGVEFHLTPIGREAFVFFVNEANPVDTLTTAQVRAIYTRRVTNWSEVGGRKEKILPFQRPADSGSQTAMEQQVMRGATMTTPLKEEQMRGMGGIVIETAAYRNAPNAIGYSFRFFVTTMTGVKNIKLLKIDGIAPTPETIRDGTYPYSNNFYAITTNRTANNPRVQELIAWFLSPQGQQLIESTGYIPLAKTP